jgi:multidrug resistance efflux pump
MTEPTLTCPTCRTEIKLTESLAAPLIEDTRRRYEVQLARKEAEVAGREAAIREQQAQITAARDSIDAQVAAKVDDERGRIAAGEAQKAKRLVAILRPRSRRSPSSTTC